MRKGKPEYFASIRRRRPDGKYVVDFYSTGPWPFYHASLVMEDISHQRLMEELIDFRDSIKKS